MTIIICKFFNYIGPEFVSTSNVRCMRMHFKHFYIVIRIGTKNIQIMQIPKKYSCLLKCNQFKNTQDVLNNLNNQTVH